LQVDKPMPETSWRRRIQWATLPYMCRINLFALGFHHIPIKGREVPRKEAPILVCNHTGFPDIWYFLWRCLPVGVSAAENLRFPVISDLMLSQQTIFVDREDRDSAQKAADMINAIARDDAWPQVVVYPEGNVANGRQLCAFKAGPFQPGLPVQPLVLSYQRNWGRIDPSWCDPLGGQPHLLAVRLMLQWHNYMEATYLPVMTPTPEEVKQPQLFAARVKAAMARALDVPCTECNFADARLTFAARKHKLPVDSVVLEMDRATREWGVTYADARDALDRFAAAGGAWIGVQSPLTNGLTPPIPLPTQDRAPWR
jgi:lysophosphatidylcholine acyltransferase/lyso-PAF acetyltransferase